VILFVRGEIGLATAPHFEAALTVHLRRQFRTPTAGLCAVTFLGRGTSPDADRNSFGAHRTA
jgi:hypothetical protein